MKKILAINVGSSSKKYSFFGGGKLLASSHYEKEGKNFVVSRKIFLSDSEKSDKRIISENDYNKALILETDFLINEKLIKSKEDIDRLGFRVVGLGKYFLQTRKIDRFFKKEMAKGRGVIPIHTDKILEEIEAAEKIFSKTEKIAVSDSSFFSQMPDWAKFYALPFHWFRDYGIQRFSYHGISAQSALDKSKLVFGRNLPSKIIICHLGSGCSAIGIKNGQGVVGSTGFGPLEGLVMAARPGDVDPGVLLFLLEEKKISLSELKIFLNKKSGLLGLAGTNDMRQVIEKRKAGDERAALAFDVFVNRVKKYIGAYFAQLGGLDMLVFTGTIGERSDVVREAVLSGLSCLGLELDKKRNKRITAENAEGFIERSGERVKIAVFKSDEMAVIAGETAKFEL